MRPLPVGIAVLTAAQLRGGLPFRTAVRWELRSRSLKRDLAFIPPQPG